jgi:nitroreductase
MSDKNTNNLIQLLKARQSVRRFKAESVDRDLIVRCVEAARLAPSAENAQPWRFIVIDDQEQKKRLAQKAFNGIYRPTRWAEKAPVLVILCAEPDFLANRLGKQITGIQYYLIDCGIAGEHFILQAQELGLGTCWIGWFSQKGVKKVLDIPSAWRIVSLIAVGYHAGSETKRKNRYNAEKICYFNTVKNIKPEYNNHT